MAAIFLLLGTEASRRKREIDRLNSEYQGMIGLSSNMTMENIYMYMVNTENYRMLSDFEYTLQETPLRSGRLSTGPPPLTDVDTPRGKKLTRQSKLSDNEKVKETAKIIDLTSTTKQRSRTTTIIDLEENEVIFYSLFFFNINNIYFYDN